jgi:hypothetical protein
MRSNYILSALLNLLVSTAVWATNELLIEWNLFRDWKPTVVYKNKNNLGEVILKYKLFGEKKAKYKLFKSFSIPLDPERLKNPSSWEGLKRYRQTLKPLLEGENFHPVKKRRGEIYIFCRNLGGRFCPLQRKGQTVEIPLGVFLQNFTLAVVSSTHRPPKVCTLLELNHFGYPFVKLSHRREAMEISIALGGREVTLKLPRDTKAVILIKEGRELRIYRGRRLLTVVDLNAPSLYLSEIRLYPSCGRVETLAFYGRSLSPLELGLLLQELF